MGASYIPKDVYTICTFQQDTEPRQLIPTRSPITVFYGVDKTRPLLTVEDRNINTEFPCKSPKNANISLTCDTEIKLETGSSSITMAKDGTITIKGTKITIDGSTNLNLTSKDVDIKGSGRAHANFNGNTTITGGQVDIN